MTPDAKRGSWLRHAGDAGRGSCEREIQFEVLCPRRVPGLLFMRGRLAVARGGPLAAPCRSRASLARAMGKVTGGPSSHRTTVPEQPISLPPLTGERACTPVSQGSNRRVWPTGQRTANGFHRRQSAGRVRQRAVSVAVAATPASEYPPPAPQRQGPDQVWRAAARAALRQLQIGCIVKRQTEATGQMQRFAPGSAIGVPIGADVEQRKVGEGCATEVVVDTAATGGHGQAVGDLEPPERGHDRALVGHPVGAGGRRILRLGLVPRGATTARRQLPPNSLSSGPVAGPWGSHDRPIMSPCKATYGQMHQWCSWDADQRVRCCGY